MKYFKLLIRILCTSRVSNDQVILSFQMLLFSQLCRVPAVFSKKTNIECPYSNNPSSYFKVHKEIFGQTQFMRNILMAAKSIQCMCGRIQISVNMVSSFQNIQKSTCLIENFATKIWKKYHFWRKLKNKVQYFFKFWSSGFTRRPRKFGVIFHFHQIQVEDNSEFCGLLRKSKLYQKMSKKIKFQSQKSKISRLFIIQESL